MLSSDYYWEKDLGTDKCPECGFGLFTSANKFLFMNGQYMDLPIGWKFPYCPYCGKRMLKDETEPNNVNNE